MRFDTQFITNYFFTFCSLAFALSLSLLPLFLSRTTGAHGLRLILGCEIDVLLVLHLPKECVTDRIAIMRQ